MCSRTRAKVLQKMSCCACLLPAAAACGTTRTTALTIASVFYFPFLLSLLFVCFFLLSQRLATRIKPKLKRDCSKCDSHQRECLHFEMQFITFVFVEQCKKKINREKYPEFIQMCKIVIEIEKKNNYGLCTINHSNHYARGHARRCQKQYVNFVLQLRDSERKRIQTAVVIDLSKITTISALKIIVPSPKWLDF